MGFVVVALVLAAVATTAAQDAARNAALILRVLAYDRNLPTRAPERVTILMVYKSGDSRSEATCNSMSRAIGAMGRRITVANRTVRAVSHAYTNGDGLSSATQSNGAAAVYICPGLDGQVADISRVARAGRFLTMTGETESVRRGLSVGFVEDGSRVKLLVNLRAARAEGARLDAAVLRLAEVIR